MPSNSDVPVNTVKQRTFDWFRGHNMEALTSSPVPLLAATFVMLTWPWIFFVIVQARHGVQLNNPAANFVKDNPHITNYLVTFIGTIVSVIVGFLLSSAVTRLSQEWVPKHDSVTIFHIVSLSSFKHHSWPWNLNDSITHLFDPKKSLAVVSIGACMLAFTTVTSSTTSLITPVPFNRMVPLSGAELDFSSNDTDCLEWFNATAIPNNCDWTEFHNLEYTPCVGSDQLLDAMELGRNSLSLSLGKPPQSLTLYGLGGLRFSGSLSGVLPIGPDGVPVSEPLPPFSDAKTTAAMLSYNYTLENQGFISKIDCSYGSHTPINISQVAPGEVFVFTYNGFCEGSGLADVLTNVEAYITVNSNKTLTFWACKSAPNETSETSYFIYLRGVAGYGSSIGNITCTVSPIQPAVFPITYQSNPGVFSSNESISNSTTTSTFSGVIDNAISALGDIISNSQGGLSNLLAETVFSFGVSSANLMPYVQNEGYLQLFAAMIQGVLDYEATYIRLIYSADPGRPSSCNRTVNGTLTYETIGWFVLPEHVGLLMPMSIINLVSLVLLLIPIFRRKASISVDPTDPKQLIYATYVTHNTNDNEWEDEVRFPGRVVTVPTEACRTEDHSESDTIPLMSQMI